MLPSGSANGSGPVKFIDTGLGAFLAALEDRGAVVSRSVFKAAGAASMLTIAGGLAIGNRNAETIQAALSERGLHLTAAAPLAAPPVERFNSRSATADSWSRVCLSVTEL